MAISHESYSMITSTVNVFGMLTSAFNVAINLWDWAKGKGLNTCDCLLLAMGISDALFQCALLTNIFSSMIWAEVPGLDRVFLILFQLQMWFSTSSFFLTASLCVFYCVEIVDLSHPLFIWLKLRISKVVPWLVMGSVMGSLVLSIPTYWNVYRDCLQNSTVNLSANSTFVERKLKRRESYTLIGLVCGVCVSLLLGTALITLILSSLYRHTKKMIKNASGFSQPRMDAHFGAARLVGSLLLIYLIMFLAVVVRICSKSDSFNLVIWIIIDSSLSEQPMVLILGNAELKKALWKFLSAWRQ